MSAGLSPRLGVGALRGLPEDVTRPPFTPGSLGTGIVHLGCGAFHRAHQALITQHAMSATGDRRWGISTVAMSRPDVVGALRAQDNLYTTLLRDEGVVRAEVVGAITAAVHAPSDRIGVVRRVADPRVRIVTLTVTTGGYCLAPSGRLDSGSDPVRHDLRCSAKPCTAIGMLVGGLAAVRRRGGTPPVVISCDNLTANGRQLRSAVLDFAALRDDRLANWIGRNVQFPCSVVDRIVASGEDTDDAAARTRLGGVDDRAQVSAEPFMTWTIENFEGERPRWDLVGAEYVGDVTGHELAKLRLLNGTHLLLAYLGALAGYSTIAEASADPALSALAKQFMLYEQGPTLTLVDAELQRTVRDLLRRFRNPDIRHEMTRVGRNGSDKMLPRVTAAMRENLAAGRPTPAAILLIAAWIHWFDLCGTPRAPGEIIDPRAAELARLAAIPDPHRRARAFLARTDIFGVLPHLGHVQQEVGDALTELIRDNVSEVIERRLRPEFLGRVA
ncbi:mannitol dehydrogenase family protein [Nocardia sp. CDC160]|uniref:mannitol dehydrogenase family protein n=1 Tax=Nocardia sp. CDC160 TaxID=3112166 RepID=UPI002DBDDCC0|nr:mannitol dehydrogenase family protein [Nocardia sp. CDC160]MEC3918980.1 mannitol dehydrogenase family protein [Nocardia sp. CDC160]